MATQQPPSREQDPAPWAMRRDGHGSVLGAGGQKLATPGADRMHYRGDPTAIEVQNGKKNAGHSDGEGAGTAVAGRDACRMRAASDLA